MVVGLLMAGLVASPLVGLVAAKGPPACNDGVDNDGDGLVDYPADPGCDNKGDKDEADGSSKPPPTTYSATWITTACESQAFLVTGGPTVGITHAEFRKAPNDVPGANKLIVTLTQPGPWHGSFIQLYWKADGASLPFLVDSKPGPVATFNRGAPSAATLIVGDCGSTSSRAEIVVG